MNSHLAKTAITGLKHKIEVINPSLVNGQLYMYENNTSYCVIALVNPFKEQVLATFALDANSIRDVCLAKAFLALVKALRTNKSAKQGVFSC